MTKRSPKRTLILYTSWKQRKKLYANKLIQKIMNAYYMQELKPGACRIRFYQSVISPHFTGRVTNVIPVIKSYFTPLDSATLIDIKFSLTLTVLRYFIHRSPWRFMTWIIWIQANDGQHTRQKISSFKVSHLKACSKQINSFVSCTA
jgi:hypothetical protein